MNDDDTHDIDILDSAGSAHADVSRPGHRTTRVVVGAAVTVAVAVGLLTVLPAHHLPGGRQTQPASVPTGAPGSMLTHEQVPSWQPSAAATVTGGPAGSLRHQQVPSWTPTPSTHSQTYREQVPAWS